LASRPALFPGIKEATMHSDPCEALKETGKPCANPADFNFKLDRQVWDVCQQHQAALHAGAPVVFRRASPNRIPKGVPMPPRTRCESYHGHFDPIGHPCSRTARFNLTVDYRSLAEFAGEDPEWLIETYALCRTCVDRAVLDLSLWTMHHESPVVSVQPLDAVPQEVS
jgi:hypothetical protein